MQLIRTTAVIYNDIATDTYAEGDAEREPSVLLRESLW